MKTQKITDKNGINYLLEKPKEGQMCQTKRMGEEGYHGKSKYTNGYFETYEDKSNRMEITRWKVDLWLPIYALLVAFLFTACESVKIPEAPYIVTQTKNCNDCKAKYKYWVKAMNNPKRTTEFITDQVFMVGDTLRISK